MTSFNKINPELYALMQELKPLTPDERLEVLLEIARVVNMPELEQAILKYWEDS